MSFKVKNRKKNRRGGKKLRKSRKRKKFYVERNSVLPQTQIF